LRRALRAALLRDVAPMPGLLDLAALHRIVAGAKLDIPVLLGDGLLISPLRILCEPAINLSGGGDSACREGQRSEKGRTADSLSPCREADEPAHWRARNNIYRPQRIA
jgi:hypothetical protein